MRRAALLGLLLAASVALYLRAATQEEEPAPRAAPAAAVVPPGPYAGRITIERDLDYTGADGAPQKFDLYAPGDYRQVAHPLMVWVHGGAWSHGDKADWPSGEYAQKVAELGFVVLNVNYRLNAPFGQAPFPAVPDDINAFAGHLRRQMVRFGPPGYAPSVSIGGHSAGGHLALYHATDPRAPLPLACVIAVSPVTDLRAADLPRSLRPHVDSFAAGDGARLAASPAARWRQMRAARVFLAHARDDYTVPFTQSETLLRAARAAGGAVPVQQFFPPRGGHALGPVQTFAALGPFLREHCG